MTSTKPSTGAANRSSAMAARIRALMAAGRCRLKHALCPRSLRAADRSISYLESGSGEPRILTTRISRSGRSPRNSPTCFRLPALLQTWTKRALERRPAPAHIAICFAFATIAHREVRIRVAARLRPADLVAMLNDTDYYVGWSSPAGSSPERCCPDAGRSGGARYASFCAQRVSSIFLRCWRPIPIRRSAGSGAASARAVARAAA